LGLILTFTIGSFFIILSYTIEPLVHFIQRKLGWKTYAIMEWAMNDKIHLQSSLNEELGLGTWNQVVDKIPTTQRDERLAILDISNLTHPRWRAPGRAGHAEMRPLMSRRETTDSTTPNAKENVSILEDGNVEE
jgi:hypothetical protein